MGHSLEKKTKGLRHLGQWPTEATKCPKEDPGLPVSSAHWGSGNLMLPELPRDCDKPLGLRAARAKQLLHHWPHSTGKGLPKGTQMIDCQ